MNQFLRNYFQSDELPSVDVLRDEYAKAQRALADPNGVSGARSIPMRLIEEMEADAEICNLLD